MICVFRSFPDFKIGYTTVASSKLLMVNFSLASDRTKNYAGLDYPHISFFCSTLTEAGKAYGVEITAQFDAFHISFSDSKKVWKLATPALGGTGGTNQVVITADNRKESATLGASAKVGRETWTADDVCSKFLQPILNLRAQYT